ncbi:MAG: hypothetical protein ABIM29_04075 [candidate division WOR-3 bacterium]
MFFLLAFLIFQFDEEEKKEESEVYFNELRINPNYDNFEKICSFPFIQDFEAEKIINERKKGLFKDLKDFKNRTGIFLPDSIFEKYFDFTIKKGKFDFFSYFEKDSRILNKIFFELPNNSINLLYSKNYKSYSILRASYSFYKNSFKIILGDYFINKGNGIIYGSQSIFNFYQKFLFFDSKYIPSSSYNRGLRGIYFSFKNFSFYFSSRKLFYGKEKFFENKIGAGFKFFKKGIFSSFIFEKNFLSEEIYLNQKNFYQISIDLSIPFKGGNLSIEYLPLKNSYFFKFLKEKNGFLIYRLDEKNYDIHSSFISQNFSARDEIGASLFTYINLNLLRFYGYTFIYRKISETFYSYKNYFSIEKKVREIYFKFEYKNTFSDYKRDKYSFSFKYNLLSLKINHVIAKKENFYYGNSLFFNLNYKFFEINHGIFNTQNYYSRIYFYSSTFFPYYELLPLYGTGSLFALDFNIKFKNFKIYAGFYEIKREKEEFNFLAGLNFHKDFVFFPQY